MHPLIKAIWELRQWEKVYVPNRPGALWEWAEEHKRRLKWVQELAYYMGVEI